MPHCNCSEQYRATPWLRDTGCEGSLGVFEVGKCQFLVAKLSANQAPSSPAETDLFLLQTVLQRQREQLMGFHLIPASPAKVLVDSSVCSPLHPCKGIVTQRQME